MKARRYAVIGLTALAACTPARRTAPPAGQPAPERASSGQDAGPVVVSEAARNAGDAAAAAVARRADSIRVSVGDVERGARAIFGDSVVANSAAEPENGPANDMDVDSYVSQERVEHFVRMFSGSARERIEDRLSRGTRYEPMIRQRLREGGLPEDMYYLALVESGFNPHAYSRAAAVGMWQFMTSTGRDMGLRIDWWVDERRDPVKSTRAAVRFIRGLRAQFGSLYLAAAAYNGGPGRVARGLAQFKEELEGQEGEDVFFALAEQDWLRKETKDYVPQLIAAAVVAKDPERYGMSIRRLPAFGYDSVRVGPESALPAIARAAGASVAALQDLNPQLLRGVTPPRTDWTVRLPEGTATRFAASWAEYSRADRTGIRRVETRKGLSLEEVASDAGISYRQLVAYNPGGIKRTKKGRVIAGQTVLVPTASVVAAALVVPDPEIERYGSSSTAKRSRRGASEVEMHVVKRGESLGTIARRYRTTVAKLQKLNRLKKPLIFPGQSLVVSGEAPAERLSKASSKSRARVVQAGRARDDDGADEQPAKAPASKSAKGKATAAKGSRSAKASTSTAKSSASKAKSSASKAKSSGKRAGAKSSGTSSKRSSAKAATKKKSAAPKDGAPKSTSSKGKRAN